ncbi:hypothetical protein [Phytoactinopolyspora endophytica]|uniref:hypothetical protein n=1 Tax=Phytoactinopolyspora endophytica TaxID=1642495 RepID=UPI00101BF884|nr:hypothetical protein [Phytoactinopolyspora endophytica]
MSHQTDYPSPPFVTPSPHGYVYAGYSIDAPAHAPFVRHSGARDKAASQLEGLQDRLSTVPDVVSSTLFGAVLMPPIKGSPRHDLLLLVQTTDARNTAPTVEHLLGGDPAPAIVFNAVNTHRIGDTESNMDGTFLFNHFTGADSATATSTWKHLTGWYIAKAGIDNSTLLDPQPQRPFAIINYVRLPGRPLGFLANQFRQPSFFTHVRARLKENDLRAMPLFYKVIRHAPASPAGGK